MLYFFKKRAKIIYFSDICKDFGENNCFAAKMGCFDVE